MQELPDFNNRQKRQEWPLALAACNAFRRHTLEYRRAPDDEPGHAGSAPDFVFADTKSGELWNIEVKRLVPAHVREVAAFASSIFSEHLDGRVPGTYTCEVHLDATDPTARLALPELERVIDMVLSAAATGTLSDHYEPLPGYYMSRIDPAGSHVEPWLWDDVLEPGSTRESEALRLLCKELDRLLDNSLRKFRAVPAARNVLIVETRGTLLDRDLHTLDPRSGEPFALAQWMSYATTPWSRTDTVLLDPHVSVWHDGVDRAILMGTKYSADEPHTPLGTIVRLWPGGCPDFTGLRLGLPSLMELSECSCS
jgi:hypothetical protein